MEDLVSRGHRYQDLVDGYPVGLVLNFHQAARLNRRLLVADLAVGVSLGIRDAFSQEGRLVQNWGKQIQDTGAPIGAADDRPPVNNMAPWLQTLPVVKVKKKC